MKRHAMVRLQRNRTEQSNTADTKIRMVRQERATRAGLGAEDGYDWLFRIGRYQADSILQLTGH
ncbi:MAG TPA: hypothetical protein VFE77_14455 [Rhodanobacter sp.]|nr:hypothetical protein [Rhodanobacter sp.]